MKQVFVFMRLSLFVDLHKTMTVWATYRSKKFPKIAELNQADTT